MILLVIRGYEKVSMNMILMIGREFVEHTCKRMLVSPRIMIFLEDNVEVINGGFKLHGSMNIVIG